MKIIEGISHLDHGLLPMQVEYIQTRFADRTAFFIETVELPYGLGTVACNLMGPVTGCPPVLEEDVEYRVRGTRKCASRVIPINRVTLPSTRLVTVIAGPAGPEDGLDHEEPCVLYTAYGGPQAPREPGDLNIRSWEELEASRAFWAEHALAL